MKKQITLLIIFLLSFAMNAQDIKGLSDEALKKEFAENACSCIDSINVSNKSSKEISGNIHDCIDKQVTAYQSSSKLFGAFLMEKDSTKQTKNKNVDIVINTNPDSKEYKKYYYEIERYLMDNCKSLKNKVASNQKKNENSISDNPKALEWYYKAVEQDSKGNYVKAIKFYKKAIKLDPNFAFAWDNMGLLYRKLEKYDKAIEAYENSLKIDPNGKTPLQNIAVVYVYTKEFDKAIKAYERLAKIDKNNPEVFYGIGFVSYRHKNDYEKGLQNMCKAYNLYIEQKSPYRTDAEKVINLIYVEMKKNGKENRFKEILKENNINVE